MPRLTYAMAFCAKCLAVLLAAVACRASGGVRIWADVEDVVSEVSPGVYGTGMEDVNHEIYGGLDAQRVFGESFEENPPIERFLHFESSGRWFAEGDAVRGEKASPVPELVWTGGDFPQGGWVEMEFSFLTLHGKAGIRVGDETHVMDALKVPTPCIDLLSARRTLRVSSGKGRVALFGPVLLHSFRVCDGCGQVKDVPFAHVRRSEASACWAPVCEGGGSLAYEFSAPHSGAACQRLVPGGGVAGVANAGLNGWGIPVAQGRTMEGRIHVRGRVDGLSVSLESADFSRAYAVWQVPAAEEGWERRQFSLTPDADDPNARFVVRASGDGSVCIDDVYLAEAGERTFAGCRADIAHALAESGVKFLRWGGTMANSPQYLLANMGEARRPYLGYWYRHSSGGFGVREFVRLADALSLACAFCLNAAESPAAAAALARDLRRLDGDIFVQVGNEECFTCPCAEGYREYCRRFRAIALAMRAENPSLKFVAACWWRPGEPALMEETFRALDGLADCWDLHPYVGGIGKCLRERGVVRQFMAAIRRWNPATAMRAAVFEENGDICTMERALCHALMMESVREAGKDLLVSCPANAFQPWRQNDNGWDQGQIFFSPQRVWLSPPGYAQMMASASHRDLLVRGGTDDAEVSVSATRSRDGLSVVLHVVNIGSSGKKVSFDFGGAAGMTLAKATALWATALTEANSLAEPNRVAPVDVTAEMAGDGALRPHSYTVVEFARAR